MDGAVIVQVEERDASLVDAMLAVCTKGLTSGECTADRTATGTAVATIEWQDTQRLTAGVRVEWQGSKAALGDTVRFTDADDIVERYKAVGLVIATLVGEVKHIVEEAPTPTPTPSSTPTPNPAPTPAPRRIAAIDVGAVLAGPDLWRGGVIGRLIVAPLPWLFLEADERFTLRPPDSSGLSARSSSTMAGVGIGRGFGWLWLAARVDGGAEILFASAEDGGYQSDSFWVGVLRAGVEAAAPANRWLGAFLGVDGGVHRAVVVHVHGAQVASFPLFELDLSLGVRFSPF